MLAMINAQVKDRIRILKNVQDELYTSRSEETRDRRAAYVSSFNRADSSVRVLRPATVANTWPSPQTTAILLQQWQDRRRYDGGRQLPLCIRRSRASQHRRVMPSPGMQYQLSRSPESQDLGKLESRLSLSCGQNHPTIVISSECVIECYNFVVCPGEEEKKVIVFSCPS
jgi:hypothetical protein